MRVSIYIIVHSVNVVGCEEKRDVVTVLEQQRAFASRLFISNVNIQLHREPPGGGAVG
jgi:uncharacterized protein YcfL